VVILQAIQKTCHYSLHCTQISFSKSNFSTYLLLLYILKFFFFTLFVSNVLSWVLLVLLKNLLQILFSKGVWFLSLLSILVSLLITSLAWALKLICNLSKRIFISVTYYKSTLGQFTTISEINPESIWHPLSRQTMATSSASKYHWLFFRYLTRLINY